MFENNNQKVIRELAFESFKCHRTHSCVAVLSIFLATFLLACVVTMGMSFLSTADYAIEQTPGPEADGYLNGSYEVFEKAEALPQVEWADYVRKCSAGVLHNAEFTGMEVRLFAPEESFYLHNHIGLISGAYPQKAEEILISDTLLARLGLKIGDTYELEVPVISNGREEVKRLPMEVCGIFKNPLFSLKDVYDEIYTEAAFAEQYNPEFGQEENLIYVKLGNLNPFLLKSDVGGKLYEVAELAQTAGYSQGKNSSGFAALFLSAVPFFLFVILLMTSGYFLIYNIFYISITSDIRWFGMLKTIGMTEKQIRRIENWQVNLLSILGILPGLCAGYLISGRIAPMVMELTDWSIYYKAPGFFFVALSAALFAWITVKLSTAKSVRMAARISPAEAQRFTPQKKKYVFSVISLALGGILFLAATNAVIGFDAEKYVNRYNQNDYRIFHKASLYTLEEPFVPISEGLVRDLEALPFVGSVDQIYMARAMEEKNEWGRYPSSRGEILPEGKIWDYYCHELNLKENRLTDYVGDRGTLRLGIAGLPPARLHTEAANYQILDGVLDQEKFASGSYFIFNEQNLQAVRNFYEISPKEGEKVPVRAGDRMRISFYQEQTDTYVEKELTVLAVIRHAFAYTSSDVREADLILPDSIFKEIYPNYRERISALEIAAKKKLDGGNMEMIQEALRREHSTQLMTVSRYESMNSAKKLKLVYGLLGFLLVFVLSVIGISNVVNTVTAHVLAGKDEYAAMQAVGMTKRQLFYVLLAQGIHFSLPACVLMLPAGWVLSEMLTENTTFTGFNRELFFMGLFTVVLTLLLLCVLLAAVLEWKLTRKTIVERLRDIE